MQVYCYRQNVFYGQWFFKFFPYIQSSILLGCDVRVYTIANLLKDLQSAWREQLQLCKYLEGFS